MTDCEHTLPLREKIFASRSKGRRCVNCDARVFVSTPLFDGLLTVTPFVMVFLLAFAWIDGGIYWVWLAAVIVAHVGLYLMELESRTPVEYDFDNYRGHTMRNRVMIVVVLLFAVGAIYLVA